MSSFIFEAGNAYSFKDYCLLESIKPKQTKFGINSSFDNGEILEINGVFLTSFVHNETLYTVVLSNYELGFHGISLNNINFDDFDYKDIAIKRSVDLSASNAISVFSNVFFIIKKMIDKLDLRLIIFNAENKKLGKMYTNLMKNKFFIKEFESMGFRLTKDNDYFIFNK